MVHVSHRGRTKDPGSYDRLYRLLESERGTLTAAMLTHPKVAPKLETRTFAQDWQLDRQDNWLRFRQDDDGDGTFELRQSRTHDRSNRVTYVSSTAGVPREAPRYDGAGNMTRIPVLPQANEALDCEYDGWNRLVRVRRGGKLVAEYEYDGLGRRTVKRTYDANGDLDETRHFYYSHDWRLLQEQVEQPNKKPWQGRIDREYVWGVRGLDDLIVRVSGLEERLYALADANGNVVSLYDVFLSSQHQAARIIERVEYDPYGEPQFMDKDFNHRPASSYNWNVLYGGYYYDAETGLYHVRNRMYHPLYGRWLQTDPSAFEDSYNLYQYGLSSPLSYLDPMGLRARLLDDPLEWAYGSEGAIWDVSRSQSFLGRAYRASGEGFVELLGREYLAQAGGWELVGLTTAAVTAAVLSAMVAAPVAGTVGLGAWGSLALEGGVAGGAEYLTWTLGSRALGGDLARGPTIQGLGTHMAFGALTGVAGRAAGRYAFRPGIERALGLVERLSGGRRPGALLFNQLQGDVGHFLARWERRLRAERVLAEEIWLRAGGKGARIDLLTRRWFSNQLRVVESKLGKTATLMRGQPRVYEAMRHTRRAVGRGPKTVRVLKNLGFSGTYRRGVELTNLRFTEQRFPILEEALAQLLR